MKKVILLSLLLFFFCTNIFSQTDNRTSQKIKEDQDGFQQFKAQNPELFLNKRLPIKLLDGNFFINGFSQLGIRLTNNHLVDSVYHNFHKGSTEKDIIPYSNILITEPLTSIDIFRTTTFIESSRADSASIAILDTSSLAKGILDNKPFRFGNSISHYGIVHENELPDTIGLEPLTANTIELRISLNGKLLFDWTPLYKFPKNIFKVSQKWPPTKYGPFWLVGYEYGFHIAEKLLSINDQLLIEIKETKKGWMLDRFNITRVAVKPTIIGITIDYSNIEYRFRNRVSADSSWQALPQGRHALSLNLQPDQNFDLYLRYKFQPENINHYTITVKPYWWQKKEIIFPFILLILLLLFVIILKKQKKKKLKALQKTENQLRQSRLELKAIYAQLNPHFIFNALTSIQGLINKNEIEKTNLYLVAFSNLLRDTLKNNDSDFVPLSSELKMIESYVKLEQLRFNFRFSIDTDKTINENAVEIPTLLLQPLIENAIKHGISAIETGGTISITITASNRNMEILVGDNGIGFNELTDRKGYGLKLTTDRIQLLNQSLKGGQLIKMQIESNKDSGTTVHLVFENWLDT